MIPLKNHLTREWCAINRLQDEALDATLRKLKMSDKSGKTRRIGAAAAFIDARLTAGRVAFPFSDLVRETGLSATAAKNQLLRLGSQIVRVSRPQQFFLIVSPEHRPRWSASCCMVARRLF
jgi:hypothetical protein